MKAASPPGIGSRAGRLARAAVLVVAGVVALMAGAWWATGGGGSRDAEPLYALSLPDTQGVQQSIGQWRGKVLVVNFWATWCEPCRKEMPEFVKAQDELGGRGLQFVGIAIDTPEKSAQFVKEVGLNYPSLVAGFNAIDLSRTFGNSLAALPFTLIIDRQGKVVLTQLGPLSRDRLDGTVRGLL